jgi:predicted kinase
MPKLIILRGNSGSGKSAVALEIAKSSKNKIAIIDADMYRVTMLWPKPFAKDDLAALMRQDVIYCLNHGYAVIWDSIFHANDINKEYLGEFLTKLHPNDNYIFNFDVSFEETARRHQQSQNSNNFTAEEMKEWYRPVENLGYKFEYPIAEQSSLNETVSYIKSIANI